MKLLPRIMIIILPVVFLSSCLQPLPNNNQLYENPTVFSPEWFDALIEIAKGISLANTASAPVNPYVLPIGAGLAGITAMLEALRRKERSGRKHAEGKLNFNSLLTPTENNVAGKTRNSNEI